MAMRLHVQQTPNPPAHGPELVPSLASHSAAIKSIIGSKKVDYMNNCLR